MLGLLLHIHGKGLTHDPDRAPLVTKAFDEFATGRFTKGRSSTDGSRDVRSGIGPTSACRFAQARLRSDATSRTTPPMSATAPRMGGSGIRWCSSALISMDPASSTVFSRHSGPADAASEQCHDADDD